jgi:hypothetical protein
VDDQEGLKATMSSLLVCVWIAGALHLVVASANIFAFRKFRYLEHLQPMPLVIRQVFLVQNAYIMLVQIGLGFLCLFFAEELISGRPMCRAIGGFLALFWGSRVGLQLFYSDRELRRANRFFDVLFLLADGYLAVVFAVVMVG